MNRDDVNLILGSPGCGKTTRLLEIVEMEMSRGVPADRIAFVSFTKAAANEAADRAASQFSLDPEKDLPWFRTIHSLAYGCLGLSRDEVMGPRDWKEFSQVVGEPISGFYDVDAPPLPGMGKPGDIMLRIVDYASTTLQPILNAWHELNEAVDWYRLKRFSYAFSTYKSDVSKMDFTDMLRVYIDSGDPINIEVAVIDEGQDLTPAQWAVVYKAFSKAKRIYIAGDDDQAIYRWAGADVEHFLTLSSAPEVLSVSHRLPRAVFTLSQEVAARISHRYSKPTDPADREGDVRWHMSPEDIDMGEGTWLLLARNSYLLSRYISQVRLMGLNYAIKGVAAIDPKDVETIRTYEKARQGKVSDLAADEVRMICKGLGIATPQLRDLRRYTVAELGWERIAAVPWHEALEGIDNERRSFYASCLRSGTKLSAPPRIRISTIHGVKGAEADHVAIMTDMSGKTMRSFDSAPDHEHRVFYVGITRARHSLHIIAPQSDRKYSL